MIDIVDKNLRQRKMTNYKHITDKLIADLILGVIIAIHFMILWHFVCYECKTY